MALPRDLAALTSRHPLTHHPRTTFTLSPSASTSESGASNDDDDDDTPLPFPAALPRSDFLAPDFSAADYLSSLPHRHQTLEDLRGDLRERGAAISSELLALVNANYASFLGLGDELRGGEDRVEDVRVALLGFRRAVEDVRTRVRGRGREVAALTGELGDVRRDIEIGRKMLELDERVAALEERLAIGSTGPDSDESDGEEEDDDGDEDGEGNGVMKLTQLASDYIAIDDLADEIGRDVSLVRKIEERMLRCRNTLILDLNAALKEARKAGDPGRAKLLRLMGVYATLGAEAEAIRALKSK